MHADSLSRPVRTLVVRHLRARQGAGEVSDHGAGGRLSARDVDESRRLPALLHVRRPPAGAPRHRQHPMSLRQPLDHHAARLHVLGSHPAFDR